MPDGRHVGFAALEASRPWFLDELDVHVSGREQRVDLCPRWLGTVEPGSVRVIQTSELLGAVVHVDHIWISLAKDFPKGRLITVTVAGVRRGFLGWHFKRFTARQAASNAAFYRQAYRQDYR